MFLQHHVLHRVLNYLWFMNGNSCLNKTSTTQQSNWIDTIFSPLDICRIFKYLNVRNLYMCVFMNMSEIFHYSCECQSLYNLSVYLRTREHATCTDLYPCSQSLKLCPAISLRVGQTIIQKYRITYYLLMHIYQL